jgi:hypothetical protein
MQRLGARSIPIVSKGDKFVFAQVLQDVVDFLEIDDDTSPKLTPAELGERYLSILDKAIAQTRQMPDEHLTKELPNRPRSWLVLMHHLFQIPVAFLDMEDTGETLAYEKLVAPPPLSMKTSEEVAAFGEQVKARFQAWFDQAKSGDFKGQVPTYFGGTSRHEMLERTVWHSAQHVRQVGALLGEVGITPTTPVVKADIEGLPLTDKVWG